MSLRRVSTQSPRRVASRVALALALLALVAACKRSSPKAASGPDAAVESPSVTTSADVDASFTSASSELDSEDTDAGAVRARSPAKAAQKVDIPAGKHVSGSTPGDVGRDPGLEPALVPVDLTAFSIDALPYPNDPASPPRTGVSHAEAARLCGERGARLCTELEWERACKGPDADPFATGGAWDTACDKEPATCASGFGVRALGATREWTDSKLEGGSQPGALVLRGAGKGRCAARTPAPSAEGGSDTTFRCCYGAKNAAAPAAIEQKPPFHRTKMEAAELGKIIAQVPELKRIGSDVTLFDVGDVNGITGRSHASHEGISFTVFPVLWSPEPGTELLVAVGHTKVLSFVIALHVLPEGKYRFASSLLLLNDLSPLALAYQSARRKELFWTACWGCAGEQGPVSLRSDHRVVIVQQ